MGSINICKNSNCVTSLTSFRYNYHDIIYVLYNIQHYYLFSMAVYKEMRLVDISYTPKVKAKDWAVTDQK